MTCPACGEPFGLGEKKATTVTGRVVHERCEASLTAAAAGVLANADAPVAGAIATEGWFARLRARRRRGDGGRSGR
jgi:hypothetical protein